MLACQCTKQKETLLFLFDSIWNPHQYGPNLTSNESHPAFCCCRLKTSGVFFSTMERGQILPLKLSDCEHLVVNSSSGLSPEYNVALTSPFSCPAHQIPLWSASVWNLSFSYPLCGCEVTFHPFQLYQMINCLALICTTCIVRFCTVYILTLEKTCISENPRIISSTKHQWLFRELRGSISLHWAVPRCIQTLLNIFILLAL